MMAIILALVGGFLDAYTYITRDGVFATAQTGNTVLFAVRAASTEYSGAIQNIPPFVAFIAGVLAAEYIKDKHTSHRRAVLLLEFSILFIVGWLPNSVPNMLITMCIAFVSSLQIATFNKLDKWSYNSTITTGNLRTAAQASYAAFVGHDPESRRKFIGFTAIITSFICGALIGTFFSTYLGNTSIWIAAGIILITVILYHRNVENTKAPLEKT
ncbi:YoaK family protein [Bacillus massiliigorillae]|uniref:YoaK family protein n=1 Tax=Bacillus massiliigorillae TaxID=1243664 RepID=UPI001E2D30FB|nr:YoaK family protein [Bacillus massiliigorillae]